MTHPPADRSSPLPAARTATALPAAAVIVHDQDTDRVLLLRRSPGAAFAPGRWDLPTGKSEPGEPVTATAARELREETGLTVRPADLRPVHLVHGAYGTPAAGAPDSFLTVVFAADAWSGEPENREPHKHARLDWVPTGALPDDLVPSTATALHRYLTGGPAISLRGWEGHDLTDGPALPPPEPTPGPDSPVPAPGGPASVPDGPTTAADGPAPVPNRPAPAPTDRPSAHPAPPQHPRPQAHPHPHPQQRPRPQPPSRTTTGRRRTPTTP
ncbi:NUDIX domain-containing protein [Streptomyces albus]